MDPAAIERAREKAQAVRASLQQKQQSIVDRRRQQEQKSEPSAAPDATAATPATASGNAAATEVPPLASRADDPARESTEARGAAERPSGPASRTMPPPPVMEDFTASANDDDDDSSSSDDEDDTGSTFHDDEESSTTQGTGAPTVIAATATINEVPQAKEVRFSLSHVTPVSDEPMSRPTNDASAEATTIPPFEPLQQRRQIVAGGSLRSASVTRQVLSSPDSDSDAAQPREPRYLRYRDSLRTSLQKSATSANAARDSLASSDDTTPIKNQLLSYFDKSLPPATASGSGTAGGAASEAMYVKESQLC